jgi:hypothetical protein
VHVTTAERRRWPVLLTTAIVTVVVLGPILVSDGFALRGDMVFTPDQPWKPAWLGLDGSVPRAVPMDAVVSVVDEVIPGELLQRVILVAALVAGGLGIGRLARRFHSVGQVAAVVVYLWNPWVYERLAIGQWATVVGYGLLPWLVLSVVRARDGRPRGWPATQVLLVLMAVCAPSVGLLAALVALAVMSTSRDWRRLLPVLGMAALANLPWIVPGLLGPSLHVSKGQFADFAARGESSLGAFVSLLSMGGIWKSSVVPPERTHAVVVGAAALLAVACIAGFRYAAPVLGRRTAWGLGAGGAAALLIAVLPAIGPVGRALGSLSTDWPALGILRDSQRYLAPLGLVLAVGAAALVDRLVRSARAGQAGSGAIVALLVLAPVLLLPSLIWGLAGEVRPADYPGDWDRVVSEVSRGEGATVTLPWTGSYRGYAWNDRRAVLEPASRFLPGDVLVDDRIFLHDRVLAGEDPFLARVGEALDESDPASALRDLGVRWVLVEKGNGVDDADVPTGTTVFDGSWLMLVDLGRASGDVRHLRTAPPAWIVVGGDVAVLFVTCVSIWQLARASSLTRQ